MIYEYAMSNEYWQTVKNNKNLIGLIGAIKKDYDELLKASYEILPYSKYKLYFETGDRKEFEDAYFQRRALLVRSMLLSLLYPEERRYLITLQDMAWDICNEYSWVIPAHSLYHKIDLFSSETALLLAECFAFLNKRLDKAVKDRITEEIKIKVVDVFNNNELSWEYGKSNWTAVCTSNLGLAMMYAFPEDFGKNQERMIKSMDAFLNGFSEEGICYEGPDYWGYGFGCFVWFADALYKYTDGKVDLLKSERVKRIAGYPQYVTLCGDTVVSFSDSSAKLNFGALLVNYLYDYYNGELSGSQKPFTVTTNVHNAQFNYIKYFLFADLLGIEPKTNGVKRDYFLPDAGYAIYNKENFSFAIKAGSNAEMHNHNDVGSFIFADKDGQALCDLGSGFYSADYFGDKRYEILCNSSLGHSVPIINGEPQKAGESHRGSISFTDGVVTVEYDKAYGVSKLESLTRTVKANDDSVILTDSYKGSTVSFVERFVTQREPEIIGETVVIGKTAIKFDGSMLSPEISVAFHKNHGGTDEKVYLIDFALPKTENSAIFILTAQNDKCQFE